MLEKVNVELLAQPLPKPKPRLEAGGRFVPGKGAQTQNLRAYWKIIGKRRWTIAVVLAAVLTVVLIATVKQKPVYEAKALLEMEQTNPNIVSVQELFQSANTTDNYLETQYKILQSDSVARDVIRQLHLDQDSEFNPGKGQRVQNGNVTTSADVMELPTDAKHEQTVLARFEERLSVSPVQRSALVRVSFDSRDPQLAAKAVNTLAESYIEENLQTHWQATQKASAWMASQLVGLKAKLEKSEDDLQHYAQGNGLLYLESDKGQTENIVDERLRQLQDELTQAQADRYQKESLYKLAEGGDYGALPGVFDNKLTQDLTDRLADLERQQAELAPEFKAGYPKMEEVQSQIERTKQLLTQERGEATRHIGDEFFAAVRREVLVNQAFNEQRAQANVVAAKSVQYSILRREVDTNKQLYDGLLQRLKEAGVSAGLKASNIRVVDPAMPPTSPVKPRVALNLVLGLVLGVAGGVTLAFVQERMDNTLKSPDDIENFLRMPALGAIPSRRDIARGRNGHRGALQERDAAARSDGQLVTFEREDRNGWVRVDAKSLERSDLCEAFRGLRTSVLLSIAGRPPRSLAFISAEASEGKTTICSNLGITLAQLGKRVLIIDGDMRRPNIHDFFHVREGAGLVNYLAGDEGWRGLVRATGSKGLDCLICGTTPPNPSELLSSERMQVLVQEAMTEYNFVLLDSPPLLDVTDGRILTTLVEGSVLVVNGGATTREKVQRAQVCVTEVGAHLIGAVLNNMDLRRDGYGYNGFHAGRRHNGDGRKRASA
ncbi:MAG TPA: polysaccharide biosynthesis tyrosine autokinase [Candidatus Acidoferrales bacterium]|nr:polysaccharide biosynthesis tyrosine autokinase [Candidatus Acidoferrales bacterium]